MLNQKVSVVCLCYNHARFVKHAIYSVLHQTHNIVQLVVVDDASTDGSQKIIREIVDLHPSIRFVSLTKNVGNCKAFNIGLSYCSGNFIIDLATDDILLPNRIQEGLKAFNSTTSEYGVHFSDAELIDEQGGGKGFHSTQFAHNSIVQGDIYEKLIVRYFINSPTMMVRKEVFDRLGGYDEALAYEDFDFWIRSSRYFKYCYTPKVLVKKRDVQHSLSSSQFVHHSPQLKSTYLVCKKISKLNKTISEDKALLTRLHYEIRVCLKVMDLHLLFIYIPLWWRIKKRICHLKNK